MNRKISTPLLVYGIASLAFERSDWRDGVLRAPEPADGKICGITARGVGRELLHSPETGDNGGGGDEKKLTLTQAELDALIQKRVGPLNDKLKAASESLSKMSELEKRLAEADAEREKAREEAELKGKSELEKLQHQIAKLTEGSKKAEAEWAKKIADAETGKAQAEQRFVDHVKRSAVTDALVKSGALPSAIKHAVTGFLADAELELDEKHGITRVLVGGKAFEKIEDAGKHYLSENPYFAAPPSGGSGAPRPGGASNGAADPTSLGGLLGQGLAQAGRSG